MNTPSADALRLAEILWLEAPEEVKEIAAIIDRELALPQRNAALLLAQALIDIHDKTSPWAKASSVVAHLATPIDELREALKAIK